jgi:cytochrome c oxidase subunit IV
MPEAVAESPHNPAQVGHVERTKVYVTIWIVLLCLTALTTGVAYIDLGGAWNSVVAFVIACCKASLVILFFMHFRSVTERMIRVVLITAISALLILIFVSLSDFTTRKLIPTPGFPPRPTHVVVHHLGEE